MSSSGHGVPGQHDSPGGGGGRGRQGEARRVVRDGGAGAAVAASALLELSGKFKEFLFN